MFWLILSQEGNGHRTLDIGRRASDVSCRTSEFSSQSWSPHKAGLVGVSLCLWRSWSGLVGGSIKNHVSSIMIIGKRQDLSADATHQALQAGILEFRIWNLYIVAWDLFVICDLEFGILISPLCFMFYVLT